MITVEVAIGHIPFSPVTMDYDDIEVKGDITAVREVDYETGYVIRLKNTHHEYRYNPQTKSMEVIINGEESRNKAIPDGSSKQISQEAQPSAPATQVAMQ